MPSGLSSVALAYYALPLVAVVLHAVLGYWIYRNHWTRPGGKWFVIMLGVGGVEVFLFWLLLISPPGVLKHVLFYPVAFMAFLSYIAFAVFAGKYTGTDFHRHWLIRTVFAVILGGFVVLSALRPVEDLLTTDVRIVTDPIVYPAYEIEPGLAFIYLLVYLLSFYINYKLIVYLLSTSARATRQLTLLISGSLSVVVIVAASQAGLFPAEGLNHAPYATIPFILLATLALFRFDLLRVQPVARTTVVENLRDPVLVLDDERHVVDYNEAATSIWSDLDEHVGDPFETVCPTLAEAVDLDDADTTRLTLPAGGRDRHYSVTVSQVAKRDGKRGWLSILLRDVTALEQSRWQLEKQNERLDQVASTISHDLRNPINVADGYTEILDDMIGEDGLDADDADQAMEYLGTIRTSHDRMESIIADILTIAREGKTVAETESVSLSATAEDAWANVDTEDATLTVTDDRQFQADRSKLLSILENLFRNSLDHGPTDVTVEVSPTPSGFAVADDGPGIPDKHADNVFEYGYTTTEEGTGLGLSIVRTMAESHGWTVAVETEPGQHESTGTRFVFAGVGDGPAVDGQEASPEA